MFSGTRAHIHDNICRTHRVLIVFDNEHGVPETFQLIKCCQKPVIVSLVKADGRLIKNIKHACKARSDLGRQTYTLRLTARESGRRTGKSQIIESDIHHKPESCKDLLKDRLGDLLLSGLEI